MLQNETFLCRRFTVFVTKYNLMSKDNLIVPILEDQLDANESEAWVNIVGLYASSIRLLPFMYMDLKNASVIMRFVFDWASLLPNAALY